MMLNCPYRNDSNIKYESIGYNILGDFWMSSFTHKLKDRLYWWLNASRPFIINDEYKVELLHIDREYASAKILVTNLKNGEIQEVICDQKC